MGGCRSTPCCRRGRCGPPGRWRRSCWQTPPCSPANASSMPSSPPFLEVRNSICCVFPCCLCDCSGVSRSPLRTGVCCIFSYSPVSLARKNRAPPVGCQVHCEIVQGTMPYTYMDQIGCTIKRQHLTYLVALTNTSRQLQVLVLAGQVNTGKALLTKLFLEGWCCLL